MVSKWDKRNMTTINVRIKRDLAHQFKSICQADGTSMYSVLKDAITDYCYSYMHLHPDFVIPDMPSEPEQLESDDKVYTTPYIPPTPPNIRREDFPSFTEYLKAVGNAAKPK